eukprot:snap_masked-scaffold_5-processed-gene-18.27-mRNA-1 protein AED:1.00 eAED:1.00 QI:0/-1/0/0/-1/1/1/0/165
MKLVKQMSLSKGSLFSPAGIKKRLSFSLKVFVQKHSKNNGRAGIKRRGDQSLFSEEEFWPRSFESEGTRFSFLSETEDFWDEESDSYSVASNASSNVSRTKVEAFWTEMKRKAQGKTGSGISDKARLLKKKSSGDSREKHVVNTDSEQISKTRRLKSGGLLLKDI